MKATLTRRYGPCMYCGVNTTHGVADTAGVELPVCTKCLALDDTAPEHDPDMEPGWKVGELGTRGKQKYMAEGINIRAIAERLGVSYISVYKRVLRAEQNGPDALRKLADSLKGDGHRVVTKAPVTQVVPVVDRDTYALAYFTPKAARVAKAIDGLSQVDKAALRRWFALAEVAAVESQAPEAHTG